MGRFGRWRLAVMAALLCFAALGAAPVAASTGGGGAPFTIAINATGTVNRLGVATISGTLTCNSATGTVFLFKSVSYLTQSVGRLNSIQGGGELPALACTAGATTVWSISMVPFAGKFVPGSAIADVIAIGCDDVTCGDTEVIATVKLGH